VTRFLLLQAMARQQELTSADSKEQTPPNESRRIALLGGQTIATPPRTKKPISK
jgi:hypothetical protein